MEEIMTKLEESLIAVIRYKMGDTVLTDQECRNLLLRVALHANGMLAETTKQ